MNIDGLNYFIGASLSKQLGEIVGYRYFTKDQLESLQSITISTVTNIDSISKLVNLKNLNIMCMNNREYETGFEIDYSAINSLYNLENLIILNNEHMTKLDVSNLTHLSKLILISNSNLEEIKGLDKLDHLTQVVIVGNKISNVEWIKGYLEKTLNLRTSILDYNIYKQIRRDTDSYSLLSYYEKSHSTSLAFAEKIGIGEMFIYSFNMIEKIYDMAMDVIKSCINDNMSEMDKVDKLYKYVITHLEYSKEGLEERKNNILYNGNNINTYDNKFKYINSTYEAFIDGKVVCEGYVNMLNFLLNLVGIKSKTVYCNLRDNSFANSFYIHAANKIEIDGEWFYFDSQLETDVNNLKYFKKTRKEFDETHDILYKAEIGNNGKSKTK